LRYALFHLPGEASAAETDERNMLDYWSIPRAHTRECGRRKRNIRRHAQLDDCGRDSFALRGAAKHVKPVSKAEAIQELHDYAGD
jgi:hypothetical protein